MVHFPCPQCGKRLEVDAGFRGAVARCDHCGALISVPVKAEPPKRAKTRPAAPGRAKAAAPASTGADASKPSATKGRLGVGLAILAALLLAAAGMAWWLLLGPGGAGKKAPPRPAASGAPQP